MKYGSIAAGEQTTLETACHILESGGNAFDAAVAAVFTSMTSEFTLTSAGGGGALMAFPYNSEPILFDFFVDTLPVELKQLDFFPVTVDFGTSQQNFNIGKGSVAVPGNIAGLLHVHKRLGLLPLKVVLEPSIVTAKNGTLLNKSHSYLVKILEPILTYNNYGKTIFKPKGILLKKGDRILLPGFGDFLDQLSQEGEDFFYRGSGANHIINTLGDGGLITKKALKNYQVIERKPLKSTINKYTIYTNPAPSIGGTTIAFLLQLLEKTTLENIYGQTALARAMKITSKAKKDIYINPEDETQITKLLEPQIISAYSKIFTNQENWFPDKTNTPSFGSTTHVSIIDKAGNAASVTTTNGEGCGYFIPEMGFMMNNMLGEEVLNPSGFHLWTKQQRLPTLISPTIVVGESGPELVLGSGGSNRIGSAISQVILNTLSYKMDLGSAISAPRVHLEDNILHHEVGIKIDKKAIKDKTIKIKRWGGLNLFFGGVNAVTKTAAEGDPRRGGVGIVY